MSSAVEKKGKFKNRLMDSLNPAQMLSFITMLRKIMRIPEKVADEKAFLLRISNKITFGFLHKELFGQWAYGEAEAERVLGNLGRVKEILLQNQPIEAHEEQKSCPAILRNLYIHNGDIAGVYVTVHAWERFYEKWCQPKENLSSEQVARRLQAYFKAAKKTEMGKVHAILRTINNRRQAQYFFNQEQRCRFVVVTMHDDRTILITVERPYPKKHFFARKKARIK